MNINTLITKLNSSCNITSTSSKGEYEYYLSIYEYVKFITSDSTLRSIIEEKITSARNIELEKLNKLESRFKKEIITAFNNLRKAIIAKKINDHHIDNLIPEFIDFRDSYEISNPKTGNTTSSSQGQACSLYDRLRLIVGHLDRLGHQSTIEKYVHRDELGNLHLKIGKYLDEYRSFKNILSEKSDTALWGSFDKLADIHNSIASLQEEQRDEVNYIGNYHRWSSVKYIKDIKNKKAQENNPILQENYNYHLKRVHDFLVDSLANISEDESRKGIKNSSLITCNKEGDFYYDQKLISMSKKTLYYQVFCILFYNKKQDGFISYAKINKILSSRYNRSAVDAKKGAARIQRAISEHQGLIRNAKINGIVIPSKIPDGRNLIELMRGEGLKLNNPKF